MLDDENPSSIELTVPHRDSEISREILNIINWIPASDPSLWEKREALTRLNNMIQSKMVTLQKERNHTIDELTHRLRNREEHIRNLEAVLHEMQISFCREVDKNNALKKAEMFSAKYADIIAGVLPAQTQAPKEHVMTAAVDGGNGQNSNASAPSVEVLSVKDRIARLNDRVANVKSPPPKAAPKRIIYKSPRLTIATSPKDDGASSPSLQTKRQESDEILKNISRLTLHKDNEQMKDSSSHRGSSASVSLDDFDDSSW